MTTHLFSFFPSQSSKSTLFSMLGLARQAHIVSICLVLLRLPLEGLLG